MEEKGFSVILPSCPLYINADSGLRCISQVIFEPEKERELLSAELAPDTSPLPTKAPVAVRGVKRSDVNLEK